MTTMYLNIAQLALNNTNSLIVFDVCVDYPSYILIK